MDTLKVDAHLPTTRDRVKGGSVGVRHVKADRIPVRCSGKGGFAIRAVAKGQAFGRSIQIGAEDGPKHATSDDKVLAISLEVKPRSPLLFIRGKGVKKSLNL